jgi:Fur family transcriptional regulator, zinc uptake regulator
MPAIFPAPDHDHARCAADTIGHAEALCAARGQRLTPMRRQVLEVLATSHNPLGAYEIMDRLAASAPRASARGSARGPAPITVYRALDFLMENGLVHRIASRNAFLACVHNHASGAVVAFLICEHCGAVGEAPAGAIGDTVAAAAKRAGFVPKMSVIEITGLCSHCRSK